MFKHVRRTTALVALASSFVFALPVLPVALAQMDEPDLKKEALYHRYFKNLNENPTSEEKWQSAVTQGAAQTYTLQSGDTLWSLSETLFGDANFWPKVWSLNVEQIGNPHEILPNQNVQFMPGTTGEAPSLAVTDPAAVEETVSEEAAAAPAEAAAPKEFDLSTVTIPEPTRKSGPMGRIPGSLPGWEYRQDTKDKLIFEVQKINRDFGNPSNNLTNFVIDADTEEIGTVTETEMGLGSAGEFQYIVVKLPSAPAEKNLLVVKDMEAIKDPRTGEKGRVVQVQGEIQILEAVNAEENLYRAMVRRVVDLVEVGAKIVSGRIPSYNTQEESEVGTANAQIIGGHYGEKRQLFSDQAVVYLNGGSKAGLTPGQMYPIYKQFANRVETTKAKINPRAIGRLKVIRTSENFATAVITQASDDVRTGDTTTPAVAE